MDDVPLRLFAGVKEARDYASCVTLDEVQDAARHALHLSVSTLLAVGVVTFDGGTPGEFEAVDNPHAEGF
jgi:hypothetical protein